MSITIEYGGAKTSIGASMTVDLLLLNANLATMSVTEGPSVPCRPGGALAIAGGRILWTGAVEDIDRRIKETASSVIDLEGRCLTPGLIDCHTHIVHAGNRMNEFATRLAGATYLDIAARGGGIQASVRATRAADAASLKDGAAARLAALLAEGVTTVEIKSGYGLDLETELRMLRVARALAHDHPVDVMTSFLGAHTVPDEYRGDPDAYIDFICDAVLPAVVEEGLADAVDGCIDPGGFSHDHMRRLFARARELGLPVKLHTGQFASCGGPQLAAGFDALSCDHLEHLTENDCLAMAAAGTVAVLLPGAFYYLRETAKPNVALLRRHGISIAVSTDWNPGSSPLHSLLLAMNMSCILFGLTPAEALAGTTRVAARALGLGARKGQLATGFDADLAAWDVEHPDELIAMIGSHPCAAVFKNGVLVHGAPKIVADASNRPAPVASAGDA